MPSISVSKYLKLRTCPRLFYFEHVRFFERVKRDGARGMGSMYHLGLEAWWKHHGEGDVPWAPADRSLVVALKAIDESALHVETDPYEHQKARAMMLGYHTRYVDLEYERDGGGVEVEFDVPLLDPEGKSVGKWRMRGKKDAIVKPRGRAKFVVVEHKSTSQDITAASDYWQRVEVDSQISMYIDAARGTGLDVDSVLYDTAMRPDVSPQLATPEDKREMTIGMGCKTCGGGKGTAGSGRVVEGKPKPTRKRKGKDEPEVGEVVYDPTQLVPCPDCTEPVDDKTPATPGWKEAPRYHARVRLVDETPDDFFSRVCDKIATNPDIHYKQAFVARDDEQIRESRADLVSATIEIDAFTARMKAEATHEADVSARRCFPRNTQTCLNVYGRRCDFLPICSGEIPDPSASPLYQIKAKPWAGNPRGGAM